MASRTTSISDSTRKTTEKNSTNSEAEPRKNEQKTSVENTVNVDVKSNPDVSSEDVQYPTGAKFWLLMFNLFAIIVLQSLDMSIVATAVPRITDHFHTVADVGWYAVAFRLGQCAFQFLYGKAYKLFSVKMVFLIANGFSALGSLLCATATSSTMFVIGRAIAGVGAAGLGAGALMMLVQSTPLRRRPTFTGLWGAVEGTTVLAGPIIGGAITQTIGWRWCFYISLPLGGATLLLTFFCFSERPKTDDVAKLSFKDKVVQLDFISTLVLVPSLTCLVLAFSWAGTKYPWRSGTIIGLMITFGVLAAGFIYNQFRLGEAAVLPIRIVKRRSVVASLLFVCFQNSGGNVLEYYLPIYYQAVLRYNPAQSGYLMLPILVGGTLGAIGSGIGTSICGYYTPFMFFCSISMPIAAGLATTFSTDTGLAKIILYTGLLGLGYGAGSTGPSIAIQTILPEGDVPLGLSSLLFVAGFGPAVTISIAQLIFANQLSSNLHGLIPHLDRTSIVGTGLTELVRKVPAAKTLEVLEGINESIVRTNYLTVALTCGLILGSLLIESRSVKTKKADAGTESATQDINSIEQEKMKS